MDALQLRDDDPDVLGAGGTSIPAARSTAWVKAMGWETEQIPQIRSARYRIWMRFRPWRMPMNSIPRWAKPVRMSTPTMRSPRTRNVRRMGSFRAG